MRLTLLSLPLTVLTTLAGLLLAGWGEPGPTDLDGDGTTGAADLAILLNAWGACP